MEFGLETASPAAVPDIAEIWNAGWHEAHAALVPDALRRLRTFQSFVDRAATHTDDTRIAVVGRDILGFCMTRDDELYQMYVAKTARGSGVAGTLIADAEARIVSGGHSTAWLCVRGRQPSGNAVL